MKRPRYLQRRLLYNVCLAGPSGQHRCFIAELTNAPFNDLRLIVCPTRVIIRFRITSSGASSTTTTAFGICSSCSIRSSDLACPAVAG